MRLAYILGMILFIIHMRVPDGKRKELSQTITSLISSIRMENGCGRCDFFNDMKDENILYMLEEWKTEENFDAHRQSECFKVLRGAMHLLQEPWKEISFKILFPPNNRLGRHMKE